jgi:hypothetical protein
MRCEWKVRWFRVILIGGIAFFNTYTCPPSNGETDDESVPKVRPQTSHSRSRPEDLGQELSDLSNAESVARFSQSTDRIERRKLAKLIGDRSKAGKLQLLEEEKQELAKIVVQNLKQANSPDANERSEARHQIERLWYAAVPTLVTSITTNDLTISELCVKSLILMRNEAIIRALIQEAKSTEDEGRKELLVFALSKMKEQRKSLIPGRECLSAQESEELYNKVVTPALDEIKKLPQHNAAEKSKNR